MKFSLPRVTLQKVAPTQTLKQTRETPQKASTNSPEVGGGCTEPAHFEHGFLVGDPGSLGPYSTPFMSNLMKETDKTEDSVTLDPLIYPTSGLGGRDLASILMDRCLASPGAWFIGRQMNTTTASEYVGVANYLRCQGPSIEASWTGVGWGYPKRDVYEPRLERLNAAIQKAGGDIERALTMADDATVRELLWATYRAAWSKGDIQTFDRQLRERPLGWTEAQETLLAMKMFTEEQVNLLAPWKSLNSIRFEVNDWWRDGLIELHPNTIGLDIWKVTRKAVERGVEVGLMEDWEGESRLSIRKTQELHDLAVGDTLILAAIQVAQMGGQIEQIQVEPALRKKGEHYPDLSLQVRVSGKILTVNFEVVGTGGGYHGLGKRSVMKQAGYRAVVPGFDGLGVRYA